MISRLAGLQTRKCYEINYMTEGWRHTVRRSFIASIFLRRRRQKSENLTVLRRYAPVVETDVNFGAKMHLRDNFQAYFPREFSHQTHNADTPNSGPLPGRGLTGHPENGFFKRRVKRLIKSFRWPPRASRCGCYFGGYWLGRSVDPSSRGRQSI